MPPILLRGVQAECSSQLIRSLSPKMN